MTGPLNPCPFCGGTKIDGGYNEYGGFVSICANCDTYGPPAAEMSKDAIIAAWNTRAPEPKVQALVRALRIALDYVEACKVNGFPDLGAASNATPIDQVLSIGDAALAAWKGGGNPLD